MIAVAAWQHIAVGFAVLAIVPFASARWVRSEGIAIALVGLGAGFAQVVLGLIKPGLSFSSAERVFIGAVALVGAIVGGWRIARKGREDRKNI